MLFKEAYLEMLKGNKITRPSFKGYWYMDGQTGKLVIHLASGEEITKGDLSLTAKNCIAEDWCIYND